MAQNYHIRGGAMRNRITLQRFTDAIDTHGEVVPSGSSNWANVRTNWGEVSPLAGRELFEAQQVNPRISYRICERRQISAARPQDRWMVDKASTKLAASITSTSTGLQVQTNISASTGQFIARVDSEFITVLTSATTAWGISRAKFGTVAASHASSAAIHIMEPMYIDGIINVGERDRKVEYMCMGKQ